VPHLAPSEYEAIILEHRPLVVHLALVYRPAARAIRLEWDDLIAEGTVGLVTAADRFNPVQFPWVEFSTYAQFWIRSALIRAVGFRPDRTDSDMDRLPSRPRLPTAVPLFPIPVFDAQSACGHHGPIRVGSHLVCMVCHHSGMDGHPLLQRNLATDPRPEPKPPAVPVAKPKRETRRQRRARIYGRIPAP
jgi:hypothetical protein